VLFAASGLQDKQIAAELRIMPEKAAFSPYPLL